MVHQSLIDRLAALSGHPTASPRTPSAPPSAAPVWAGDQLTTSAPSTASPAPTFLQRLRALGTSTVAGLGGLLPQAPQKSFPSWQQGGDALATIATSAGYARGQVIRDPAVVQAMLQAASKLYGVPAHWLSRMAARESGSQHWDKHGQVKESAAVGLCQIERSAYPELVAGGEANARHNAYDLANNIAIAARQLRTQHDRLVKKSGYTGPNSWTVIGPLAEFTYSAGSGALKKAQGIATARGLDPWNWQHLLLGRSWQGSFQGTLQIPRGWITSSPMAQSIQQIHDKKPNYPVAWTGAGPVKAFDFDGDGQAHKVERMLSRTVDMVLGLGAPKPVAR